VNSNGIAKKTSSQHLFEKRISKRYTSKGHIKNIEKMTFGKGR